MNRERLLEIYENLDYDLIPCRGKKVGELNTEDVFNYFDVLIRKILSALSEEDKFTAVREQRTLLETKIKKLEEIIEGLIEKKKPVATEAILEQQLIERQQTKWLIGSMSKIIEALKKANKY